MKKYMWMVLGLGFVGMLYGIEESFGWETNQTVEQNYNHCKLTLKGETKYGTKVSKTLIYTNNMNDLDDCIAQAESWLGVTRKWNTKTRATGDVTIWTEVKEVELWFHDCDCEMEYKIILTQ
ncbi:MAG: hypothetical protein R3A11_06805 [Bdellovibrionota bacterium]